MDLKFFITGLRSLLFDPSKAWEMINTEHRPLRVIRNNFLLPLIILVSLSSFAGSLLFANSNLSPLYSMLMGLRTFVVLYFTVHITALVLGEVTFPMDLGKDFYTSFTIITYSFVPFLVCQVFSGLFESLFFLNIISLYGLYIFWGGTEKFLDPPQYKKMPLLIATSVITVVVYLSMNSAFKLIFEKVYYIIAD